MSLTELNVTNMGNGERGAGKLEQIAQVSLARQVTLDNKQGLSLE